MMIRSALWQSDRLPPCFTRKFFSKRLCSRRQTVCYSACARSSASLPKLSVYAPSATAERPASPFLTANHFRKINCYIDTVSICVRQISVLSRLFSPFSHPIAALSRPFLALCCLAFRLKTCPVFQRLRGGHGSGVEAGEVASCVAYRIICISGCP